MQNESRAQKQVIFCCDVQLDNNVLLQPYFFFEYGCTKNVDQSNYRNVIKSK